MNNNLVVFKGRRDGITVCLDKEAEFPSIKDALDKKLIDAQKFFGGGKTAISFTGRPLSEEEERQLVDMISKKSNIDIIFVNHNAEVGKKHPFLFNPASQQNLAELMATEHLVKFHNSSLRSGQFIRYDGSVVVIGDVNSGAEVIAKKNIMILGAAKGLLHAGCLGDNESFIFAARLFPTQLRIANVMTYIPGEKTKKGTIKNTAKHNASYAYIKDGQIYIAPLLNQ